MSRNPWINWLCRVFGHEWVARPGGLVYDGCWTCGEICRRCKVETWWPS